MNLLSIIVPIYNVEPYLKQCIESVISQDFIDYELILVDDGSNDNSGKICDTYALSFPERIKVIHKINGGVSSARNEGLKVAKGFFICFVDADDYIKPGYFSFISKYKDVAEILIFTSEHVKSNLLLLDYRELLNSKYYVGTLWSYVIRRSVIINNKISFDPKLPYSEDHCFLLETLVFPPKIAIIHGSYYYYRTRSDSAIHRPLTHIASESHLYALTDVADFLFYRGKLDEFMYHYIINDSVFFFLLLFKIPYKVFSGERAKDAYNRFSRHIFSLKRKANIICHDNFFIRYGRHIHLCIMIAIIGKIIKKVYNYFSK